MAFRLQRNAGMLVLAVLALLAGVLLLAGR